ncbi:hypothetical protein ACFW9N_30455 [Streptomyces sp. NPDC059496]
MRNASRGAIISEDPPESELLASGFDSTTGDFFAASVWASAGGNGQ